MAARIQNATSQPDITAGVQHLSRRSTPAAYRLRRWSWCTCGRARSTSEKLLTLAAGPRTRASTTPSGPRWRSPRPRPGSATGRRGHRRDLGRGRAALRRAAARGSGADGGDHQLLQPPQHHLPGAGRNELGLTPDQRSGVPFDCVPGFGCLQTRRKAGEGRTQADQVSCWDRYYSAKSQVFRGWRGPQCGTNDG